jgi:hypothetical protein
MNVLPSTRRVIDLVARFGAARSVARTPAASSLLSEIGADFENYFLARQTGGAQLTEAARQESDATRNIYASWHAMREYDRLARVIKQATGTKDLSAHALCLAGCDWGVNCIYLGATYGFKEVLGLDFSFDYGKVARGFLSRHPEHSSVTVETKSWLGVPLLANTFDVLVIHQSLVLGSTPSEIGALDALLQNVAIGGWVVFTPPSAARLPGMLARDELLGIVSQNGFGQLSGHDHRARRLSERAVAKAHYVVGRRETAGARMGGKNRNPKFWLASAQEAIRRWDKRDGGDELAEIRSASAPGAMLESVLASSASVVALRSYDRLVRLLLDRAGWANLWGRAGVLFGCEWGFSGLHIFEEWGPDRLLAVDFTGRTYIEAAQEVIAAYPEYFAGLEVRELGPRQMRRHAGAFDFLILLKSFSLLDTRDDRHELMSVVQVLKDGGALLFQPDFQPGNILPTDLVATLRAAGCEHVVLLEASGKEEIGGSVPTFVAARKSRQVHPGAFDAELERQHQHTGRIGTRLSPVDAVEIRFEDQIDKLSAQIEAGATKLDTLPIKYAIHLTSVCNIKCVMCNYPDLLRHSKMPEHWMQEILASKNSIFDVGRSGGEPFLSPLAMDVLKAGAQSPGLFVHAISNLAIKRKELPEAIVKGATSISCSVDAATRETYDRIRQDSDFDTVIHNLREIVRLRQQKGGQYPIVDINFTIMGVNDHEIMKFVDLARELGVDSISFKWLVWVKTPRMTPNVAFDFSDDARVRALCDSMLEAQRLSKACRIPIAWGSPPFHLEKNRPDVYADYEARFAAADIIPDRPLACHASDSLQPDGDGRNAETSISSVEMSEGRSQDFERQKRRDALAKLDRMPDGLMPCTAPYQSMIMVTPRSAAFCCDSKAKYRSIPLDSSKPLVENWNNSLFQEARGFFATGDYDAVCHPQCTLYRSYLKYRENEELPRSEPGRLSGSRTLRARRELSIRG